MKKKIGILGSGVVAKTLAKGFAAKGYDVRIGSREASKLEAFAAETGISAGSFAEVAAHGELVVLAVKGSAALEALQIAGSRNLSGKVVIDTTNPIADAPPVEGVIGFYTGVNDSQMERLQQAYPEIRFVKAWNSIGSAFMVDPRFPGPATTMFYCGDDGEAKDDVAAILAEFGFAPEDMGSAPSARALEALCQLWCIPGMRGKGWNHAIQLVRG